MNQAKSRHPRARIALHYVCFSLVYRNVSKENI